MTFLLTLTLTLLLITSTRAVPFFLPRHLQHPEQQSALVVHEAPPYHKSDSTEDPLQHCKTICTCKINKQALTVTNCTKDPSDTLNQLLVSHPNITGLTITNALLTQLPDQVCQLNYLTNLVLQNNRLETIPWGCLKQLNHLYTVDVSHNLIKKLEDGSFYDYIQLQQLILHHNQISHIGIDVFTQQERLKGLRTIDISNNQLESLEPWPLMFINVTINILLNDNWISSFTNLLDWTFKCSQNHPSAHINLQENRITHIMDICYGWNITSGVNMLCALVGDARDSGVMDIRNNKFVCDCIDFEAYMMLRHVHTSQYIEHLFCDKPQTLYDRKIIAIPPDEFICHVKQNCPDQCHCVDQPANMNMSIQCRNARIKDLPEKLPKLPKFHYHYYLDFGDNNITSLDYRIYLKRTKLALFTKNIISEISLDALSALKNGDMVALDQNKLKYLPRNISTVNMTMVKDIHLAYNKWVCDCHAKETRSWFIQTKGVISDSGSILCQTPKHMFGYNLLRISEDDLICGNPPNTVLIVTLTSVGATLGACLLLIVLPVMVIFLKRVWLYKKFKWHPFDSDECEGENKKFDIFVSYANEDGDYVEDHLIPDLQTRGYKIAYHRIHFHAGKPIHISIEECVLKSKRTLMVFSNDFLQSDWCMWEFTVALEHDGNQGTHRLLAIKYEDVQVSSLDLILQSYFSRYSYVEPNSKTFWDNLEYVLPMKKLGTEGGDPFDVMHTPCWGPGDVEPLAPFDDHQTCDDSIPDDDTTHMLAQD